MVFLIFLVLFQFWSCPWVIDQIWKTSTPRCYRKM